MQTDPDQPVALQLLGVIAHQEGRNDIAVRLITRALAIKPDYFDAHMNLGSVFRRMGKLDEAIASVRMAVAIRPDDARAHSKLGIVLQDQGKLNSAIASCHQALAIDPNYAEAHRLLASSKKFSKYDDDVKAMESAYALPSISDEQKMHLAFGLGKSFEDLRQYEKAFTYFSTGNAIKRRTYNFSIEGVENTFGILKKLFTTDLFSRLQLSGAPDDTPIFILGMPRSGTTLVEQILSSHPNVHGAGELNYLARSVAPYFGEISDAKFPDSVNQGSISHFSNAGSKYISMIRGHSVTARFITDKLPNNIQFIGIIKRNATECKNHTLTPLSVGHMPIDIQEFIRRK